MTGERKRFVVELADAGRPGDVPLAHRLRSFLKSCLRRFAIRCVAIRQQGVEGLDPGQQPGGNGAAGGAQGLDQGGQTGGSEGPPGQAQGFSPPTR